VRQQTLVTTRACTMLGVLFVARSRIVGGR